MLADHDAYYAQNTQFAAKGNRILRGWIQENRSEAEYSVAGWAGGMALPRVLSLNSEGGLEMQIQKDGGRVAHASESSRVFKKSRREVRSGVLLLL